MVHYVRFLQLPHVSSKNKSGSDLSISALVTITTDLGDTFLAAEVNLEVCLIHVNANETIAVAEKLKWHPGSRQLRITFGHLERFMNQNLYMKITQDLSHRSLARSTSDIPGLGPILGVSSPGFICSAKAVTTIPQQIREFDLSNGKHLSIMEDKGDNIATHIWDAAIGFLASLRHANETCNQSSNQCLYCLIKSMHPTRVLELGAGCGIVGIALKALFPQVEVTMTDVNDAKRLLDANIRNNHLGAIKTAELDWYEEPSLELISNIDFVFVSDCTYNSDTIPSLVNVLSSIARESPQVWIAVGMKRRHESEEVFFDLMSNHFHLWRSSTRPLPHISTDEDLFEPKFELHLFREK